MVRGEHRRLSGWIELRPLMLAAVTIAVSLAYVLSGHCQDTASAPTDGSRHWALLIAAEKYEKAPELQFTVNDVRQVAQTLKQYGGYHPDRILEITDDGAAAHHQPLKASIEAAVPEFLKRPAEADSILILFSGHGFRDDEGRLYLAPLDCDPADPVSTGVSAEWFRQQLETCQARVKVLVLDACHAGSEKGGAPIANSVNAKDLGESFKGVAGVVTLASSTGDQKSQIWQFKQQSLYSYWLNQGLKGHADADGSGSVNVEELHQYVLDHVRQTADIRMGRAQTPVRDFGPRVIGTPEVIRLHPQPLRQILADMSDQIAGLMEERRISSLGVVEFTSESIHGEVLGGDFGLLGKYCAEQLERGLIGRSAGKFSVIDRKRLAKALAQNQFSLVSFESSEALESLSESVGGMPVICTGSLSERRGQIVHIRCKVLETEGEKAIGHVGGVARLNESEWAMIGRSVQIRPEDRMPVIPRPGETSPPLDSRVITEADRRSKEPHPLLDPRFPYRLRMMIVSNPQEQNVSKRKVEERRPVFDGNDCYFPVRQGETYELWVENRSGQIVMMRLLVDGLNTLPERDKIEKGIETVVVGKRVNLDEAIPWELDPQARGVWLNNGAPTWAVRGFFGSTGIEAERNAFLVVDAEKSVAARQHFTEQIGLITAAFYLPKAGTRRVGTGLGQAGRETVRAAKHSECGNLVAIVHLRYVDEKGLVSLQAR